MVRKGKQLQIAPAVLIVKANALFTDPPPDFMSVVGYGEAVQPSGRFLISAETIDPMYLVIDWHTY